MERDKGGVRGLTEGLKSMKGERVGKEGVM